MAPIFAELVGKLRPVNKTDAKPPRLLDGFMMIKTKLPIFFDVVPTLHHNDAHLLRMTRTRRFPLYLHLHLAIKVTLFCLRLAVFDKHDGLQVDQSGHFARVQGDFHATYRHSCRDVIEINRLLSDSVVRKVISLPRRFSGCGLLFARSSTRSNGS